MEPVTVPAAPANVSFIPRQHIACVLPLGITRRIQAARLRYEIQMDAVLELCGVSKDYPGHRAVDGVSLRLERGGFYSLLGPSGCGKTTTLRMIGGFEQPTAGEILLNGVDVKALRPWQRDVSTVFQNYALFPHLSALAMSNSGFGNAGCRTLSGAL